MEVRCIFGHIKNGKKILQQVEEEQKYFKKDLNQITSGNPKYKSEKQSYTIKKHKKSFWLKTKSY